MSLSKRKEESSLNPVRPQDRAARGTVVFLPSTNAEVFRQLQTFTQNIEQTAQSVPLYLTMAEDLYARGAEGAVASSNYLDRLEDATRTQLDNIRAFREKLNTPWFAFPLVGITKEQESTSTRISAFSCFLASRLFIGSVELSIPSPYPMLGVEYATLSPFDTGSARVIDLSTPLTFRELPYGHPFAAQDVAVVGVVDDVFEPGKPLVFPGNDPDDDRGYWSDVRDRLLATLNYSIHELASVLRLSYGNVQALGKRQPQTKTTRPLLRLDGLVRAYLAADPNRAAQWLRGEGSHLLLERGMDAFQAIVDRKLFPVRSETATLHSIPEEDADLTYVTQEPPPTTTGESL